MDERSGGEEPPETIDLHSFPTTIPDAGVRAVRPKAMLEDLPTNEEYVPPEGR
jgi:hypothetical protein